MELNPLYRYQNPAEMLTDLKIAARRLDIAGSTDADISQKGLATSGPPRKTLMVIESNVGNQDVFRDRLKNNGYRVLVTRDPERALQRFSESAQAADCVIFSTGELGESALEAFNQFAECKTTEQIPAILLLGEQQRGWKKKAKLADHRVAVSMPIKLKEFREVLSKLRPVNAT
jgi:serine/threonine-protein kinase